MSEKLDRPIAPAAPFVIVACRPVVKNSLRAFVTVEMPSGMVIAEIAVHQRDGRSWAMPPSKPMLDRDGHQMRDADAKLRWSPLITFTDRRKQLVWSDAVIAAVRSVHPEALV